MKDSVNRACAYALRLIQYRSRSEKELTQRLRLKGFSEKSVTLAINRLKDLHLIDDSSLAISLEEIAKNVKLLGNRGTEFFLKKRGLDETNISELRIHASDETDRAMRLVKRKMTYLEHHPVEVQTKKLRGLLIRKGYSYETINRVIAQFKDNAP